MVRHCFSKETRKEYAVKIIDKVETRDIFFYLERIRSDINNNSLLN